MYNVGGWYKGRTVLNWKVMKRKERECKVENIFLVAAPCRDATPILDSSKCSTLKSSASPRLQVLLSVYMATTMK
jgi:hypothetical protein